MGEGLVCAGGAWGSVSGCWGKLGLVWMCLCACMCVFRGEFLEFWGNFSGGMLGEGLVGVGGS